MKLGIVSLAFLLTFSLSGCFEVEVKSEQESASLCSTEMIKDYEATQSLIEQLQDDQASQLLDATQRKDLIAKTKVACVRMNEKYKSTSCQGLSSNKNQVLNYRVSDLISQCVPVASESTSETKDSSYRFVVVDGSLIVKAGQNPAALVNRGTIGKLADFSEALSRGEVLCKIVFTSPVTEIANGTQLKLNARSERIETVGQPGDEQKRQRISIELSDLKTQIGCFKYSEEPFLLRELRQALRGLFEIQIQN